MNFSDGPRNVACLGIPLAHPLFIIPQTFSFKAKIQTNHSTVTNDVAQMNYIRNTRDFPGRKRYQYEITFSHLKINLIYLFPVYATGNSEPFSRKLLPSTSLIMFRHRKHATPGICRMENLRLRGRKSGN